MVEDPEVISDKRKRFDEYYRSDPEHQQGMKSQNRQFERRYFTRYFEKNAKIGMIETIKITDGQKFQNDQNWSKNDQN